jgi:cellulose synthase/poly-beta-1,6-N-acetylglucosamine synthase-like glycosyltransferase
VNDTPSSSDLAVNPLLSVIVPARNEERNLAKCLNSLVLQSDEDFRLGRDWELIVIDDGSEDRTRAIAMGFEGVSVLEAPGLELNAETRMFTGKTNACWFGAEAAQGRYLLFTDADTVHEAGDLERAVSEIQRRNVGLLSYSPRQIVSGFWQRALMPLVYSELASVYNLAEVNDPNKRLAAANGQFLMVKRDAYLAVDGHRGVGRSVLEDVDLAFAVKQAGKGIWFRYAPDALSTRMYCGVSDMLEGWTKNLALLFPHALTLAAWRLLDIGLLLLPILLIPLSYLALWQKGVILAVWARTLLRYYTRVRRSNFSSLDCALSVFALPLFIGLLVWSWMRHRVLHQVAWKGRAYRT